MSPIRSHYSDALRFFGQSSPAELVAEYGSPLYVYNEDILRTRCREMKNLVDLPGFAVCFSTKANGNPHLLRIIHEEGLLADAMSPGELAALQMAGFDKTAICYVCNNVAAGELAVAAQESAHVSMDSLSQLETFGRLHPGGAVMVRVNPGIGAGHHQKVITAGKNTKFGVVPDDFSRMRALLERYRLKLIGLNQHVGSLFMDAAPYLEAAAWLLQTASAFPGVSIIDFGGGFGIPYHKYDGEKRLDLQEFSRCFTALLKDWSARNAFGGTFIIEPGRYIAAECGILLGTAHSVKNNGPVRYAGTDLGFSILARPMLYDSFHDVEIYPGSADAGGLRQNGGYPDGAQRSTRPDILQTIVGNICETGDILAKDRMLPEIREGDIIGMLDAGAYGQAMSSNYTQRLRPAEILVQSNGAARLVRRRDNIADLLAVYPELSVSLT
jgi:diaminopimelate decarboxylase